MPNNLPLNWCECCIKDIANIQTGKLDANAAVENGKYPFFTCALEPLRINTFSFDGNCIYLPGNGANVGYVGYYQGKFDAYQRTYILDKIAINERYLYFSILLNWKNYNKDKQFGVATNFIRLGNLENYPINLPPLAEQERIVEKIEALFADIDEGVERLKSAQAQIKQYRQSILQSAFEGKLYKTTEWSKTKLKSVLYLKNGYAFQSSSYQKIGIPLIRISDIDGRFVTLDSTVKISSADVPQNFWVEKGDLLIAMSGATTGKLGLHTHEQPALQNQRVGNIKIKDEKIFTKQYRNFLFIHLQKEILKSAYGGAQPNISSSKIEDIDFLLPTLPEQQRIVEEIEKRFAVADELEKAVNEGLEKADKLKQSILKKAFEGKLAPQNPNDEPASLLLERIKKEQKTTKGKKK